MKCEKTKIIFKGIKNEPIDISVKVMIELACYQLKTFSIDLEKFNLKIHLLIDYANFIKRVEVNGGSYSEDDAPSEVKVSYKYKGEFEYPYEWVNRFLDESTINKLKKNEKLDKKFVKEMMSSLTKIVLKGDPYIMSIVLQSLYEAFDMNLQSLYEAFDMKFDKSKTEIEQAIVEIKEG